VVPHPTLGVLPSSLSTAYLCSVRTVVAMLVDSLPARLWLPANLHIIGSRTVHFCLGGGRRTVELDGREIARGRRDCAGEWPFREGSEGGGAGPTG
jgi:hypothetical protein